MDEDGAAASLNPRPAIVIDLHHEIVERIGAPQAVARAARSEPNRPVVATIAGVFAPGIVAGDAADREAGARAPPEVRPPPQPDRVKSSARGRPVAFAFERHQAGASQRDRNAQGAGDEPTAVGPSARPGVNAKGAPAGLFHRAILVLCRPGGQRDLPRWAFKNHALLALYVAIGLLRAAHAVATKLRDPEPMVNSRRILIVDDDADMRDALVEQLALHDEFEAVAVDTGTKGVQAARAGEIDLVIMDVGLPDIDGREAVRMLRKNGFKAPVIMLTGHDTDSDTILGLESGANDYVAKPFRFAVLLARIRAQLRQHDASEDAVFNIGPYTFRPSSKLLVNPKGNKVRLTEKETAILRYLYRAGRRPVSREILLQEVWGYNSGVTTHTLETHIYRLRQKVEKDASNPSILVTEAGGYKLIP
jgi:DNA-binding response OmpR family regulator